MAGRIVGSACLPSTPTTLPGMDALHRRLWRALEHLAAAPTRIERWLAADDPGPDDADDGEYHFTPTLVACLDGAVRLERRGRRCDLAPGEILLIDAGVRHRHAPLRRGAAAFGQGFMASWSDIALWTAQATWTGRLPLHPSRRLIDRAMADPAPSATSALLHEVLGGSVEALRFAHPAVDRMLRVLWRRVHLGITADDLVRASGLGRAQAWAVFTAAYGVTPRQAIVQGRLWLAERRLAAGDSVAETARRCGFSGPDVLTRAWTRTHGAPPRRPRRSP